MAEFQRRTYRSLSELVRDVRALMAVRGQLRPAMRGAIDPAFRERLMLMVTGVNRCRYCSYAHARMALSEGLSEQEIAMLGRSVLEESPQDEVPALLYAQHWAESDGEPDREARARVEARYGSESLERIELILRMIRTANLLGNTFDYVLHRVSLGRLGGASTRHTRERRNHGSTTREKPL